MITFTDMECVGPYLPHFFSESNPRPAREQIDLAYRHGGGWRPFQGFTLRHEEDNDRHFLIYPGDPPVRELARAKLRDETLIFFEHSWLVILQPNGAWEVSRVD